MKALTELSSEVNIKHPTYTIKLSLCTRKIDVDI